MKKFLSLVLALVMTMSLVTISAGAEKGEYTDDASITYDEAVDVVSALNIVGGSNNNFMPKGTLTRGAAAKIICNLVLGVDVANALPKDVTPFSDVPANSTFSAYIAYCASEGIVGGYGDGTYRPSNPVSGNAFLKMLLCALGYDASVEGFNGGNMAVKVAMLAKQRGLLSGLEDSFVGSKSATREEAALYAFNTLKANTISYSGNNSSVTIGDIVIENKGTAQVNTNEIFASRNFDDLTTTKNGVDSLAYDESKPDDFKRPAHSWSIDDETYGPYADEADYTVVAAEDYSGAVDAYKDLVDEDYTGTSVATKYVNGGEFKSVKAGDVVEFYLSDKGVVTHAIVIRYDIGEVTKVDTKVSKADKEDGVSAYVTVKTIDGKNTLVNALKDTKFVGFDYAKNDVILFAENAAGDKVLASKLAESVEGTITAQTNSKVAVDGTYYEYVTTDKPALDAEGTFYLNAAGQIMDFDATVTKSGNYAYIYKVNVKSGLNSEGIDGYTTTVYYVDQAGVKASAVVDATIDDTDKDNIKAYYDSAKKKEVVEGVVAFKINSDGEFETVTGEDTIETPAKPSTAVDKKNAVIGKDINANGSTKFIFVEETATKVKVSVVEGYKNVKIATSATVTAITDKDNYAVYAFVDTKNGNVEATGYVAVLLSTDPVVTKDDDNTYWTFSVSIDGEDTTITTKTEDEANTLKGLDKGWIVTYNLEDGYVVDVNNDKATGIAFNRLKTVSAENDDYVVIDGKQYNLGTETVYTIVKDYKTDGKTIDSVTVTAGGEFSTENKVTFTTDDGDLDIVFIIEEIK